MSAADPLPSRRHVRVQQARQRLHDFLDHYSEFRLVDRFVISPTGRRLVASNILHLERYVQGREFTNFIKVKSRGSSVDICGAVAKAKLFDLELCGAPLRSRLAAVGRALVLHAELCASLGESTRSPGVALQLAALCVSDDFASTLSEARCILADANAAKHHSIEVIAQATHPADSSASCSREDMDLPMASERGHLADNEDCLHRGPVKLDEPPLKRERKEMGSSPDFDLDAYFDGRETISYEEFMNLIDIGPRDLSQLNNFCVLCDNGDMAARCARCLCCCACGQCSCSPEVSHRDAPPSRTERVVIAPANARQRTSRLLTPKKGRGAGKAPKQRREKPKALARGSDGKHKPR